MVHYDLVKELVRALAGMGVVVLLAAIFDDQRSIYQRITRSPKRKSAV